ncbi:MAG TPA: Crp/Fnr family transcriptional regulator [Alphaproteobacteria bacterium]|nr:Crp/Fnr family transcriptional regulator [Alphaproteobacteria bacterium]
MLDQHTLIDHLRYNDLFELFPAHIRASLLHKSQTQAATAGTVLYKTGEAGTWMGALLAGRVRICVRAYNGREILLNLIERGRTFGETSVFDGLPRHVDAVADTDVSFAIITREAFMSVLPNYPDVMQHVITVLCHRTRLYAQKMELFALQDLPTRLAYSLLRLAKKYGQEQEGRMLISARLNQSDLGQQLAASRESINKNLKLFADKGLVALEGQDIALLDVPGLEQIAFHVKEEDAA